LLPFTLEIERRLDFLAWRNGLTKAFVAHEIIEQGMEEKKRYCLTRCGWCAKGSLRFITIKGNRETFPPPVHIAARPD
jgi:hypothetical protein